ncbi:MAG: phosphohistidine phosphatase SixA [bacterium]
MKLYLLRHGSAVDIGEKGVSSDEERMLTREGRECTTTVLRRLRKVCRPQRIWTSPLVRARETAEIACEILSPPAPLSTLKSLSAGTEVDRILPWLKTCEEESLMLVGHMPDLAILAACLTMRVKTEAIILKKSGLCCIEFDGRIAEGKGQLVWLVTPSLLSRLEP